MQCSRREEDPIFFASPSVLVLKKLISSTSTNASWTIKEFSNAIEWNKKKRETNIEKMRRIDEYKYKFHVKMQYNNLTVVFFAKYYATAA